MVEKEIPHQLAEQEAVVRGHYDRQLAAAEDLHLTKVRDLTDHHGRREKIWADVLKAATREKYAVIARGVSPESASKWVILNTAKVVQGDFEFDAEMECVSGRGMLHKCKTRIRMPKEEIATLLLASVGTLDEPPDFPVTIVPPGSIIANGPGGIAALMKAEFIAQGDLQLDALFGFITIEGMSDEEISNLVTSPTPAGLDQ
jgi:hypothetical protein